MPTRNAPLRRSLVLLALAGLAAAPPEGGRPTNRLAKETSPYLLQHAHNPVDWYPWGPEAFAKARAEKKPIFLSVGYSSCYWCHVMERESFEDAGIARALNAHFVCIKVDREERPDVDQIYMTALQALGPGGGGWPMSMFLTPDGRPFFGATYLPPRDRDGTTGFLGLIGAVSTAWEKDRPGIEKSADALTEAVRDRLRAEKGRRGLPLTRDWAARGLDMLAEQFDAEYGGFGYNPRNPRRPKFPEPPNLVFLLDQGRRSKARDTKPPVDPMSMLRTTLDHMARGGIRDHLPGGYHRYSTDRYWAVPHFEKMLYDNAQLATVHLLAFEATGDPRWRAEAEATFGFIDRQLTAPEGGFYSSLDAETKAGEGAYYVWTRDEVKAALGDGHDDEVFAKVYGLTGEPNFEGGRYVLHEPAVPSESEARLAPLRARLLAAREKRPAPRLDDKVLTAWNGLTIAAYADGYRVLRVEKYRRTAEKAAHFLLARLRAPDGRLFRTYRDGRARLGAYLEDYAFLAHGLLKLHAATGDAQWLREARSLADRMIADFEDRDEGGFFFTADGHESLLARPKDPIDNALPSGNAIAILDLLTLHDLTGEPSYRDRAGKALGAFSTTMIRLPHAMPMMLIGLESYLDGERGSKRPAVVRAVAEAPKTVSATVRVPDRPLAPGAEFDAVVLVAIGPGWHLYANPAGTPEMKPTTLRLDPASRASAELVNVTYPAGVSKTLATTGPGKVALYEGRVEIRARIRIAAGAKPGPLRLTLSLHYQACNDRLCLAPDRLPIPLDVAIGR